MDASPYGIIYYHTSEYVTIEGITSGPDLPESLADHAMINTKKNLTMVIGGDFYDSQAKTYYYNHTNEEWINGPRLNQARQVHAVGIVTDEVIEDELVIGKSDF